MNKIQPALKKTTYLAYYLRSLDKKKFFHFFSYANKTLGHSWCSLGSQVIKSVYQYNIGILDYFYFRFFEKSNTEKKRWAGTGFMYEYQLKMNPKNARELLENKIQFLKHYHQFIIRQFVELKGTENKKIEIEHLLKNPAGKIVLKNATGQVGAEVEIINCAEFTPKRLLDYAHEHQYNLAEEFVIQHPALMALSPSGLNTVRIFSQIHNNKVEFLGARLRLSVNSPVDNMAAGNIAAPVDIETGIVSGPGVYSDITKEDEAYHPVTGKEIVSFQIPFWKETLEMVTQAALDADGNLSVGWDIAITAKGPELIEGNHNWCKLLWQLPVKQGLKPMLEKYLNETK